MSTTLRIDESLRERISRLAHALSQTPHSFMVEALAQKADEAEWRLACRGLAQQRDIALQAGEPGVEWHEMKTFLCQRLSEANGRTVKPGKSATKAKRA